MRNLNRLISLYANTVLCRAMTQQVRPVKLPRISELVLIGVVSLTSACAVNETGVTGASNEKRAVTAADEQLRVDMVRDLVSVVPQLLEPFNTTIQFNEVGAAEVLPAVEELVKLGYGMQRVDADQGKYFLNVNDVSLAGDVANKETRLRISLGDIEITRSYRVVNSREYASNGGPKNSEAKLVWRGDKAAVAAGPISLAGTRIPVNVTGFEMDPGSSTDGKKFNLTLGSAQYTAAAPIEGGVPTISLITDDLVQQVAQNSFPSAGMPDLSVDTFTLENMSHVFDEAFASLSDNYTRIRRETVIFPNDSQNLGRPGKLVVKKVIGRYAENTDLVGIVGCSNGYTNLDIGNEGLALGRAKRIAEEFYSAGISRDRVFNEGCWSPNAGTPGFPNRGVVIDLWRRKG